ncbi:MAG: formyl transferase [Alphaproteobacteria bacterium]|nr:formyl transferase [Alphaproteobacteria bacterium]
MKALRIRMLVDPARARIWQRRLAEALRGRGHDVALVLANAGQPQAFAAKLLLTLERLVYGQSEQSPGALWKIDAGSASSNDAADLVLDLTGLDKPASDRTLRPVYAGTLSEDAAIADLLAGNIPTIGVLDSNERMPRIFRAAVERPRVLCKALDNLCGRLETVFVKAVAEIAEGRPLPGEVGTMAAPPALGLVTAITERARAALTSLASKPPHWFVGWRMTNNDRVADTLRMPDRGWARLPDDGARFFADPFLFMHAGRTWLFLEEYQYAVGKALLSVVELGAQGPIGAPRPIIERAYHLSYPFVFERDGQIWMVPEMSAARRVELLRATNFPFEWEPAKTLIEGPEISDATIVEHQEKLWLFASTGGDGASSWDTLSLWSALSLMSDWHPHEGNPVLIDAASARPAGAMYRRGADIWRPAQDCAGGYGSALTIARVAKLDDEAFEQEAVASLHPSGVWPGIGLHTLNAAGDFEVVDGATAGRL